MWLTGTLWQRILRGSHDYQRLKPTKLRNCSFFCFKVAFTPVDFSVILGTGLFSILKMLLLELSEAACEGVKKI